MEFGAIGNKFTSLLNPDKKVEGNGDKQPPKTQYYHDVPDAAVKKAQESNVFGAAAAYQG